MWFCQQEEISLPKKTVRVCGVMALCSHDWRMAQSALHMKFQMCSSKSWNTHAPWRGSDFYNCAVRWLPNFVDGSPHASTSCFNADSPLPSRESTPELLWCSNWYSTYCGSMAMPWVCVPRTMLACPALTRRTAWQPLDLRRPTSFLSWT